MKTAQIAALQEKMQAILLSVLYHNNLDLSLMTEDADWFVGSAMSRLRKDEIEDYLACNAMDTVTDSPVVDFKFADFVSDDVVSLVGELQYQGVTHPGMLTKVSFQCSWVCQEGEWKIKQLLTTKNRLPEETAEDQRINAASIDGQLLLKSIPVGIICCDWNQILSLQLLNENMLSLLQFDSISDFKQLLGASILNAIHPEDAEEFNEYLRRLQDEKTVEDYVCFRLRKKDFSYLWIQALGMVIQDRWVVFACTDYTLHHQRLAEASANKTTLAELQENYRAMVDNMPSGFHLCALHEPIHVDYVSDGFCKMTGYSQHDIHDVMDSVYIKMVVPEDHHIIIDGIKQLIQYPHTLQSIYRIKRKDGSIIRVLDNMRSVRHADGKMWGYSTVLEIDDDIFATGITDPEASRTVDKTLAPDPSGAGLASGQFASQQFATSATHAGEQFATGATSCAPGVLAPAPEEPPRPVVEIHTFGYFEVLIDGRPVAFKAGKAKELLAFLVDRRGNYVSRESIITAMWENETVNPVTVTRCRKTYKYLLDELKSHGIDFIVSTENNMRRVVKENIKCDLYDYLDQVPGSENSFSGSYLTEYSWSEITLSTLLQQFDV